MAGVGRRSDFGKSEFDDNLDVENRLDATDPFVDDNIPYEDRIDHLMHQGMSRDEAIRWIEHAKKDAARRAQNKTDILHEQTEYRKVIGDLTHCTPVDESCMATSPFEEEKTDPDILRRQKRAP